MRNPLYPLKPFFNNVFSKVGFALGIGLSQNMPTLRWEIERRAVKSTADYIDENMTNAIVFNAHWELLNYSVDRSKKDGLIMEFGVYKGKTLNYLADRIKKHTPTKVIWGFDSFSGLPSDWSGYFITKETFDLQGYLPKVRKNTRLIKGFFDKSIDEWLEMNDVLESSISLLHIDSDLYESCVVILEKLKKFIVPGTFILFDEYFNYPNWKKHEYLAFQEFISKNGIKYEYLAFHEQKVLVKICEI
ncbi:Macrocin-O-methyltransferase (TylF) [Polynucleobacter meluiroseus]|uniref:Macrocin-O-methyltransferase (TylF) n=1 Tax=Polynucleobacter meluiroseus TaxID=1938814 RepID=A0A240E0Y5_9BURK|nr:TylF/MycF/NovP-related O-methyltransferase [Polynucleobacter meluiroseus]SNX29109.1 Macrocin-O-methyltransferase (TylF) [Polynucleobacter meluiroseus]